MYRAAFTVRENVGITVRLAFLERLESLSSELSKAVSSTVR